MKSGFRNRALVFVPASIVFLSIACLQAQARIVIVPLSLKQLGLEKSNDSHGEHTSPTTTINITAVINKNDADRSHVTDLVTNQFFPGRPFLESIIVELCRDILEVFGGKEIYGIELFVFDFTIRKFIRLLLWLKHGIIVN